MQSALAIFLAFLLFANTQVVKFCLYNGEVKHVPVPVFFPATLYNGVEVKVDFDSSNFDVSFCVQQLVVSDNILSCSREGKFNVTNPDNKKFQNALEIPDFEDAYKFEYDGGNIVNVGDKKEGKNIFYPRDGKYYISVALANYLGNNSRCESFEFTLGYEACAPGQVGPKCQTPITAQPKGQFKANMATPGFSRQMFYNLSLTQNVKFEGEEGNLAVVAEYPVQTTIVISDLVGAKLEDLHFSLRRGSFPLLNLTDAVATYQNTTVSLTLSYPIPDNYYIYVDAPEGTSSYEVDTNTIFCPVGTFWSDNACKGNVTVIGANHSSVAATEIDGDGELHYFLLQAQNNLKFGVGTENLKNNAPAIAASINSLPGNMNGLVVADGQKVNFINVALNPDTFLTETTADWYVALNATVDAYYWANQACPNNCSKDTADSNDPNGLCNQNNGTCTCDKGYKGLFCVKDNKILWIILIVILVAIIIACIIGVPLAIHFKNKRRSSYETV